MFLEAFQAIGTAVVQNLGISNWVIISIFWRQTENFKTIYTSLDYVIVETVTLLMLLYLVSYSMHMPTSNIFMVLLVGFRNTFCESGLLCVRITILLLYDSPCILSYNVWLGRSIWPRCMPGPFEKVYHIHLRSSGLKLWNQNLHWFENKHNHLFHL